VSISGLDLLSNGLQNNLDRGQGWNNATTDCAHFVTAMENVATGKQNHAGAINGYETEVIERGIREVSLSRELTNSVHHWDRFLQSPVIIQGGSEPRENKKTIIVSGVTS
jgi:hypothetical protein